MSRRLTAPLAGLVAVLVPLSVVATSSAAPSPTVVVPAAAAHFPAPWHQEFVVHYGRGRALLGTSRGGESGKLRLGPDYGARGPDGTWWFLDAAKRRLAHYSARGRYLDQVRIPTRMLVQGRYFQWQLPHVMSDGTLVAARQTPDGTFLLRLRHGVLDEVAVAGQFFPTYDDGGLLYGYADGGRLVTVDPDTGALATAAAYRTPGGTSFTVRAGHRLKVRLGDVTQKVRLTSASGARAQVGVQVRAGADGALQLFLYGAAADDESRQLVGATSVSAAGVLAPIEALPNPFSEADTGSPSELVVRPGSSTPELIYVEPDGVHVYTR